MNLRTKLKLVLMMLNSNGSDRETKYCVKILEEVMDVLKQDIDNESDDVSISG